jgi:YggT family protein
MQGLQVAAGFISTLISLYTLAIVVRIFLSWGGIGAARFGRFYEIITRVTDPYLNIFRGVPGMQRGMFDFSPIIAMITLGIFNNVFRIFADHGKITFGVVLALITQAAGSVISFFITILIVLLAVRILLEYRRSPNSIQYIAILDSLIAGTTERVHRLLLRGREIPARTLLFYSVGTVIVIQIIFRAAVSWLTTALIQLPF